MSSQSELTKSFIDLAINQARANAELLVGIPEINKDTVAAANGFHTGLTLSLAFLATSIENPKLIAELGIDIKEVIELAQNGLAFAQQTQAKIQAVLTH